ncbi:MAG: prealbumin-like fold domain-containing protein, partial [Acutalibacteraceae bacterium]
IAGDGNTNKSYLTYGDNGGSSTAESQTVTYTWKMPVFKYTLPVPDGETNMGGANTGEHYEDFFTGYENDDDVSISMLTTGKKTDVTGAKVYNDDVGIALLANEVDQKMPVAGATFTLSKTSNGSNPINLVSTGTANQYRVAKTGESGAFTEITTDTSGEFVINGLDSGTYYLTETGTPAGFNSLSGSVMVVIGANGAITVNNTLSLLLKF